MFMKHYAPNRCEPRIEALNFGVGSGDQGRCERRSEVFVKIQKKILLGGSGRGGGRVGGFRMDVNEELKFL